MASSKWKTYEELQEVAKNKKVIFWGASDWIGKTLDKIKLPVEFIVDNSKLNQGVLYNNYEIKPPKLLKDLDKNLYYIIITSGAYYLSIIEELEQMGYVMGDNFCCSPELNKRKDKDELLSHKADILIASPKHTFDKEKGGGLYIYSINPERVEKVYSGKCRGLARDKNNFYIVDMLRGVVVLNSQFEEIDFIKLQKNSEPHGLAVDETTKQLFVAQPGRDSIAVYNLETRLQTNEIFLSEKWKYNKKDNHHINDLCIYNNSLFATLFSFSGNWSSEVYDGGVIEIDKTTGKVLGPVISGMWMPHSIQRINSELIFLNSMMGELCIGAFNKQASFNTFVRGLAFDGKYYYIGSSMHRYPEKLQNFSNNIGLDCGFYMYNPKSKMSKFFKLNGVEGVHSLLVL